jgi:hypothetical protein
MLHRLCWLHENLIAGSYALKRTAGGSIDLLQGQLQGCLAAGGALAAAYPTRRT